MIDLAGLPAADRVRRGLDDLADERPTLDALWLAQASRRLAELGIELPECLPDRPELSLYELAGAAGADAHGRYSALRRELVSFLAALEKRVGSRREIP